MNCLWTCIASVPLILGTPSPFPSGDQTPEAIQWTTLDGLAAHIAEDAQLPGVALAWARLGEEPHVGVAGVRALGGDHPIEPGDRFHIGSITKSVTATALAALVERGKLSWDDRFGDLLPDIEMNDAFAGVELRRLLRHQAGIVPHLTMDDAEMARLNSLPGTPTQQRAAYVAEVLALDPLPEGFHYSNAGYTIAAYIGERVSGTSWQQLLSNEVFKPLELRSFGVGWPATPKRPDQPRGHFGERGKRRVQGLEEYRLGAFVAPAGNVHGSVADLTRYGLAHLAGLAGRDGFLKAATIRELHRVNGGVPYAAGWGVDPRTGQHRHRGSAGTFFSYLTIDPKARLVVAFLTNAGPSDGLPASARAADAILHRYADR